MAEYVTKYLELWISFESQTIEHFFPRPNKVSFSVNSTDEKFLLIDSKRPQSLVVVVVSASSSSSPSNENDWVGGTAALKKKITLTKQITEKIQLTIDQKIAPLLFKVVLHYYYCASVWRFVLLV